MANESSIFLDQKCSYVKNVANSVPLLCFMQHLLYAFVRKCVLFVALHSFATVPCTGALLISEEQNKKLSEIRLSLKNKHSHLFH